MNTSPTIKAKVHSELLNILFRQVNHMLWAEAFAATLIFFILWWPTPEQRSLLLGWYAFMVVCTGIPRYVLTVIYKRHQPSQEQTYIWERAITALLFISALGWSFVGTVLLPENNILNEAMVLFLLVGVAATANPFYSPIKKIYAIFLIPTLLFTAINLLLNDSVLGMFAGIAVLTFGILMLITAFVSSRLIATSLKFRFQNMELAEDLLEANKTLENLATHDTLTKLPNRQLFNQAFNKMLSDAKIKQKEFAILFLDIDKFKKINDTLGHDIGDELLKIIAKRLYLLFHKNSFVCRLGGDEFIVLIANTNPAEVSQIAEGCRKSLAEPIDIDKYRFAVSTSIGISFYPENGITEEALIKNADTAMYVSKERGGNRFTFYRDIIAVESD